MPAFRVALVSCASALLASCSVFSPQDLRLKSVEVTYLDRRNVDFEQKRETGPGENAVEVLKFTFYSRTNLFATRRATGFNIGVQAAACNDEALRIPIGYVYWNGYSVNSKLVEGPASGQDIAYSAYAPVRRDAALAARTRQREFDFQHKPFDVCLRVHGGNMAGLGFTSNQVLIPQQQISNAFHKQEPPAH